MVFEFDGFVLDTARVELLANGARVPLEPKVHDLLELLIRNRDRVVAKDELFEHLWPGVFVSDASISAAIKQLRRALGDDGEAQRFVRTVRGRGFRFVADVGEKRPAADAAPTDRSAEASAQEDPSPPSRANRPGAPPLIAVLPFVLVRADEAYGAGAEGLAIELISALSRLRGVRAIARGATFRLDPRAVDLADLRARLGTAYALSGTVEVWGGRLLVTAELVDARSAELVWSESFDSPVDDVFAVRQRISQAVCNAVEFRLPQHEAEALRRVPSEHLDAWGRYHLGLRHLFRFNAPDRDAARAHLERAVEIDPGIARAHGGLAFVELERFKFAGKGERADDGRRGLDLAAKAADLDPLDPFCSLVMARATWLHGDLEAAQGWAERAVKISPHYASALYELGKFNAFRCRADEAERLASTAMSLSPLDPHLPGMASTRSLAAFLRDDAAEAVRHADLALRTPTPHFFVFLVAAAIFSVYGEEDRARKTAAKIGRAYGDIDKGHLWSLFGLRDDGRQATMLAGLERLGLS
mgnify:CR=1 FL=1